MNLSLLSCSSFLVATALFNDAAAQVSITLPIAIFEGSAEMIDVRAGTLPSGAPLSSDPTHITAFGDGVLFAADMGFVRGRELWFSDGTSAGTRRVKDLFPMVPGAVEELDRVGHIAVLNGLAYFAGRGTEGVELWVTDGTDAGTVLFMDINPGPGDSKPQYLARVGRKIYFAADDGTTGLEPWVTDGLTTQLVKDIVPGFHPVFGPHGSSPRYFAGYGAQLGASPKVVFQADDGDLDLASTLGRELWFTDGTPQNTQLLANILPGKDGSVPQFMTAVSPGLQGAQRVVFSARVIVMVRGVPQVFRMPWVTDFTPGGTMQLVHAEFQVDGFDFVRFGDQAYFVAAIPVTGGFGIWRTDGTPSGTVPIYSRVGGSPNAPMHLTKVGHRHLYANGLVMVGPARGSEPIRIDVTNAVGFGVYDLTPFGGSGPHNFFGGTPALNAGGDHQPFAVSGNKVFLAATIPTPANLFLTDTELFVIDNGATSQAEQWGCGNVKLEATDPLIGTAMTIWGSSQLPNPTNFVLVSRVRTPLQFTGITGCQFYGSFPLLRVLLPTGTDRFFNLLTIPNDPSLHGVVLNAQALVCSSGPVLRLELSNPVRMVLGRF